MIERFINRDDIGAVLCVLLGPMRVAFFAHVHSVNRQWCVLNFGASDTRRYSIGEIRVRELRQ